MQFQTDADVDVHSDGIKDTLDGNPNNRGVTPTGSLAVFPAVDVEFYTLNGVKYQFFTKRRIEQHSPPNLVR